MLDKDLYDSLKSIMVLYMQNREHGKMILELVEHDPLIWPTGKENGVTRTKKYAELSAVKKIQADCDMQATNIILQGLPSDIYSFFNHHRVAKGLWERIQLLMQVQQVQGRQGQSYSGTGYKSNATSSGETIQVDRQGLLNVTTIKTEDLDTHDSNCDDISNAKAVLMDNISNYGSNVISEVPHYETYLNDMENQIEQALWLPMFDPTSKPSNALPVKIEAPKELLKISLVNESLIRLKFHLAKFDNVVKIRTTPNARTEEYLQNTQEQADILWGIVEQAKAKQPLDNALDFAKSKKSSHQPKAEEINQEKLYLLHMDLCGPMHVASIHEKRYKVS
nr:hypothetical protein [Tanacetum cinerariifolium]